MAVQELILTDEMQLIADAVKAELGLPVLNYQYGYVEELNETLQQWERDPVQQPLKFPLIWFAEPFTVNHDNPQLPYGEADFELFIINKSDQNWKASDRMANNYKPVIYPIYESWKNQIVLSSAFNAMSTDFIKHKYTNRYYFGENKKSVLNDVVDCMRISVYRLPLSMKKNCTIFSNI